MILGEKSHIKMNRKSNEHTNGNNENKMNDSNFLSLKDFPWYDKNQKKFSLDLYE